MKLIRYTFDIARQWLEDEMKQWFLLSNTIRNKDVLSVAPRLASAFLLLLVSAIYASVSLAEETGISQQLTFGIVPQQSASKLARLWVPILTYLSEKSGIKVTFKTAKDIPSFEQKLADGEYDIAYMNPYHYVVFHEQAGYRAFAKQKHKKIRGIIVVRKDSPIDTLEQLNGQFLAFPSPAAFAASILTQAHLAKQHIVFSPKYVASHDSVYRNVAAGLMIAGGGIKRTLMNTEAEIRENLRILWTSDEFTPHAFAAHPRVSALTIQRLLTIMRDMEHDPDGKKLLAMIQFKAIDEASDQDWDDIRALQLDYL